MTRYTVKRGDTLGKIARKFYGDARKFPLIVSANDITNPNRLKVGQVLIIPNADTPTRAAPQALTPPPVTLSDTTVQRNERRLSTVHPVLAIRGRTLIELCAHAGLSLLVTQALRTWKQQDELYAKGRTKPGKRVTNAKGGQSYHNFGLAFDIVVLDSAGKPVWDDSHPGWALAGKLGGSVGFEWGGNWTRFKDRPHFQYTGGLSLAECRKLYNEGGTKSVWQRVS